MYIFITNFLYVSMCGIEFPLTYSISKSNAINLIVHLSILHDVTG